MIKSSKETEKYGVTFEETMNGQNIGQNHYTFQYIEKKKKKRKGNKRD